MINPKIKVLVPEGGNLSVFSQKRSNLKPFDDGVIGFIDSFSNAILKSAELKQYPELVALAFWMHPARIKSLDSQYNLRNSTRIKIARGIALHFAPANVDTIFIYSLFLSLLAGNRNLVRISSKNNEQQVMINNVLAELLLRDKFSFMSSYLMVISYDHDEQITKDLSSIADCRVIWGGDETVKTISAIPLAPTSVEIKFANKYSLAILNGEVLRQLPEKELALLSMGFINDAYWFGQMGCSSPLTLVWLNDEKGIADELFWPQVKQQLQSFEHHLSSANFVNKLVVMQDIAIEQPCQFVDSGSNEITRILMSDMTIQPTTKHCGGGLFYEYKSKSLKDIDKLLSRKIQTIAYFGLTKEELVDFVNQCSTPPDRIVPVGKALDFNPVWDGYDLLENFTREVVLL